MLRDKVIEGITNIKDESDKKGMRLVLEIKRGESPQVITQSTVQAHPLQTSINMLMLGLLEYRPLIFSLRQLIEQFLYHRREIIYKRTVFNLKKAQDREHLLAGFIIALKNIDEVVALIKIPVLLMKQ